MFRQIQPSKLRTFLVLGRVSNLPTVWSNCLAGWWLSGGGKWLLFLWLCLSASCLYVGGMFLNDAFDSEFDRQQRSSRPIPSGAIEAKDVWLWGIVWLMLGGCCLAAMGKITAILTFLLIGCILIYDAIHKAVALSPLIMAACRTLLYLVAASVAENGVSGGAVWASLAVGVYVIGVTYLSRKENPRVALQYWPLALLAGPIVLALLVDDNGYRAMGGGLSIVLCAWIVFALRHTLRQADRNIGYTVSRLLAGIVLVDLLAVVEIWHPAALLFVLWFALALVLQRYIPAT